MNKQNFLVFVILTLLVLNLGGVLGQGTTSYKNVTVDGKTHKEYTVNIVEEMVFSSSVNVKHESPIPALNKMYDITGVDPKTWKLMKEIATDIVIITTILTIISVIISYIFNKKIFIKPPKNKRIRNL